MGVGCRSLTRQRRLIGTVGLAPLIDGVAHVHTRQRLITNHTALVMPNRRFAIALSFALVAPCVARSQSADVIITNARIYTVDENRPVVDAMAIREGRVVATGPQRGVMT